MIKFNIIVATTEDMIIGNNHNDLPWKSSKDLRFFKDKTKNNVVIMGRKTYESIGKPLEDRINIVISRTKKYNGCIVVNSFDKALYEASKHQNKEVFVIGGAMIYQEAFKFASRLYLTKIKSNSEELTGNIRLDGFNDYEWDKMFESGYIKDGDLEINFIEYNNNSIDDNIFKRYDAKFKAYDIINSCITSNQIDIAKAYIEQYSNMFDDKNGYCELINDLMKKDYVE